MGRRAFVRRASLGRFLAIEREMNSAHVIGSLTLQKWVPTRDCSRSVTIRGARLCGALVKGLSVIASPNGVEARNDDRDRKVLTLV